MKIALANLPFPRSPADAIAQVTAALDRAASAGASIVCFPECYVPGYRGLGHAPPPPDDAYLEHAWQTIGKAAAGARVAVVLGTERIVDDTLLATALVFDRRGERLGFQDKVQIDPSEEGTYTPGAGRAVFRVDELTFGVVICHEGWRYPETVRWTARRGAQVVFHPHYSAAEPGAFRPTTFADPANTFHEKAVLCRAAENTCYFASVNYASDGSPTTSAIANPDGTLLAYQPYGEPGLLVADLDPALATGVLATRCKS
ncbi:MAG: carbon-nitrogen hydrolase family protein [Myxococcota bacterium]|nr:carbon-nitrogen hydrolase family protein [Myxococcota bacterium]